MKTSVRLTGNFATGIAQVMIDESIAFDDNSFLSENKELIYDIVFFFRSAKDAKLALEKTAKGMGRPKSDAYFLPNVDYKWMKIRKKDINDDSFLKAMFE